MVSGKSKILAKAKSGGSNESREDVWSNVVPTDCGSSLYLRVWGHFKIASQCRPNSDE